MNQTGLVEQVRRSGAGAGRIESLKGDERRWSAVQVGIYKGRVGDFAVSAWDREMLKRARAT